MFMYIILFQFLQNTDLKYKDGSPLFSWLQQQMDNMTVFAPVNMDERTLQVSQYPISKAPI